MIRLRTIAAIIVIALGAPVCADPWLQHPVIKMGPPVRIALPDFVTDDLSEAELAHSLSRSVASDLKQTGAFEPVDQVAILKKTLNVDLPPDFSDWRRTGTHALVTGRITRQPDDRIKVEFRLWDVSSGALLVGQQYIGNPGDLTGIGRRIASDIYQSMTK